jgi:hypothetical protein
VPAFEPCSGEIGDFVVPISSGRQRIHGHLEQTDLALLVLDKVATLQFSKIIGVFFVGQAITRDMFGAQGDRSLERGAPLRDGLTRNAEHQVDVHIVETGVPEEREAFLCLFRVMHAAQRFEQGIVPGLNAKAETGYAGRS